ncbi:phosphatase PAP2 family protein [Clostridium sp. cel8]|jgi:undecaprenyl-diphosphatase|uniref:phosphatase PAP2 family protein n=1 Tax=unclassified Clostridium TaxID=2614128 RepID=UPI0015F62D20|nr:phosphatase PAP2 family protein [Clostridium sp. cel8]MBA5851611.1 phosphatase PAP2 family protein [Clostridium sp. cel8]
MKVLINEFDSFIFKFIEDNMYSSMMDKIMIFTTKLGNTGIIWIAISLFLIMSKKNRKAGIVTLAAVVLGAILGEGIIKNIVQRPRPFEESNIVHILISKPKSYSFPSGHTTAAFAATSTLSRYFKKYSIGLFILAILIAFSRIYLYVHYPTDILGGIILGLICSRIVFYIFNKK